MEIMQHQFENQQSDLSQTTFHNFKKLPEMQQFEPHTQYPEQRLWIAVICQAFHDYETLLRTIQFEWRRLKRPVKRQLRMNVEELERHMHHGLFQSICDHADIGHDLVRRNIMRLKRAYEIESVPFDDSSRILSDWQLKQVRYR